MKRVRDNKGRTWFILFYVFRVLPEDDVNQVRQHISAYSVVYSLNQVRQNMCRTINKNGYLIHEQRKEQFRVCYRLKTGNGCTGNIHVSKANFCGSFYSIQPFLHFCLITWPLYSDHTTSEGSVLGTASAQLFSDTWLEFCLSRVKSVFRTGESSMTKNTWCCLLLFHTSFQWKSRWPLPIFSRTGWW